MWEELIETWWATDDVTANYEPEDDAMWELVCFDCAATAYEYCEGAHRVIAKIGSPNEDYQCQNCGAYWDCEPHDEPQLIAG